MEICCFFQTVLLGKELKVSRRVWTSGAQRTFPPLPPAASATPLSLRLTLTTAWIYSLFFFTLNVAIFEKIEMNLKRKPKSDISGLVAERLAVFGGAEADKRRRRRRSRRDAITRAAPDTDTNVAPEASITLCRPFSTAGTTAIPPASRSGPAAARSEWLHQAQTPQNHLHLVSRLLSAGIRLQEGGEEVLLLLHWGNQLIKWRNESEGRAFNLC